MSRMVRLLLVVVVLLAAIPFAISAGAAEPMAPLQRNAQETAIPNEYIVVFDDSVDDVVSLATALVDRHGGSIIATYENALKGFSAELSSSALDAIRREPSVAFLEQNIELSTRELQVQSSAPWGLDRIDQRDLPLDMLYRYGVTGVGVNIYILDSGVRLTHQEFGGRATAVEGQCDSDPTPGGSHGTIVASVAAGATFGVAKGANIHAIKNYGCDGGTIASVIAAVDWITANHVKPAVVNMSFGWGLTLNSPKTATEIAVENSIAEGVHYVGATDNAYGNSCADFPSRIPGLITVSNSRSGDDANPSAMYGPCVDIYAPGTGIPAATTSSDNAQTISTGTSLATPHVAGVVALYLQRWPDATPAEVFDAIISNATVGKLSGNAIDAGAPNLLLYAMPELLGLAPDAGGPYTIAEGDSLTLQGSAASEAGAVTYSWDINGDDVFGDATGANPTLIWEQLKALGIDDGTDSYEICVEVSDGTITAQSSPATMTLNNAAPTVTAPADATATEDIATSFSLGSFSDPGLETGWTVTIDWGDGSTNDTFNVTATGSLGTLSHTFATAGTFTVTTTVADTEGSGSATFSVVVSDITPPVFDPPLATLTTPATSPTGAHVDYPLPTATDNTPGVTVNCDPPPGSWFPVGTTIVTCTATDTSLNATTEQFSLKVLSAAELLAQLRADTNTLVTDPVMKRVLLLNLSLAQATLHPWTVRFSEILLLTYEVQVQRGQALGRISPEVAHALLAQSRAARDAMR